MPLIDFKEIPKANTGDGNQDTFELFARDFLAEIGYEIIEEPARGADDGKDLIVLEKRIAQGNEVSFRYLVSCKHFAHNQKGKKGKSVTPDDEQNILDRVKSKNCDGFIGFYSTLPSEGLMRNLRGLSSYIGFQTFDSEKIESLIVGFRNREALFLRYFPKSYKTWKDLYYYTEPVKLFKTYVENSKYKYSYLRNILEMSFKSLENTIKPLKESSNLDEFFLSQNITLVIDKEAREILYRDSGDGKPLGETLADMALSIFDSDFLNNEKSELPQAVEENANKIKFPPNFIGFGMTAMDGLDGYAGFFVFLNKVVIVEEMYKELEDMFYELKDILS